jgi:Pyruvate/2-oxoacid:ferredoxin oxidoreductase delta subunit
VSSVPLRREAFAVGKILPVKERQNVVKCALDIYYCPDRLSSSKRPWAVKVTRIRSCTADIYIIQKC